MQLSQHFISIAPMLDWTDRHYRYFMRLITRHTRLYTEMLTTGALLHGDALGFLKFHPVELPLALQLGGSDPKALAQCAQMAAAAGYTEINLNVGCPSDRVKAGKFGACLMAEPQLVADGVLAMREACSLPITVKTRIGIDKQDNYEFLEKFIDTVSTAGCQEFIIHARKAWLKGLSPKQNREIPPLCYDVVYQIKQDFPKLSIIINGGIQVSDITTHLNKVNGVMIGRAAYYDPYLFATVDQTFFNSKEAPPARETIIANMLAYIEAEVSEGTRISSITRHMMHLFAGLPGARQWRQNLSKFSSISTKEALGILQKSATN